MAQRLQQRYDNIESLSFKFFQDTRGEIAGRPRKGSGKAVFFKDKTISQMRWDYTSPETQILVSDGKQFSMYFANLQQMIVTPASNLDTELTYAFFTGKGRLIKDFDISMADENFESMNPDEYKAIKLDPKQAQSQVQDIHLLITGDSLLRRISIRDHFGTITVLNLSDIKLNSLSGMTSEQRDSLFAFTPPAETEIIHQ